MPVPWGLGHTPHLIRAADEPDRVAVIHNSTSGAFGTFVERFNNLPELAPALHTLPSQLRLLGNSTAPYSGPSVLRDGDVLWDSFGYDAHQDVWPPGPDVSTAGLSGLGLLVCRSTLGRLAALLAWGHAVGAGMVLEAPVRERPSRTRSPSPCPLANDSPRLGRWQPRQPCPMQAVISRRWHEYRVACPFNGNSETSQFQSDTSGDALLDRVRQHAGEWAEGYVMVLPAHVRAPVLLCPTVSGPLVTIVVHAAGDTIAALVPSSSTLSRLLVQCRRLSAAAGSVLGIPPALRRSPQHSAGTIYLRHGDQFELCRASRHPDRRVGQLPRAQLSRLPHTDIWFADFLVEHSEWVYVWSGEEPHGRCERRRVHSGARWSAAALQFLQQGSLPTPRRWVPVPCMRDGQCHFVVRSEPHQARVLIVGAPPADSTACITLTSERVGFRPRSVGNSGRTFSCVPLTIPCETAMSLRRTRSLAPSPSPWLRVASREPDGALSVGGSFWPCGQLWR